MPEQVGRQMQFILAIAGSAGFVVSCVTAGLARVLPSYQSALQDWAGGLILGSAILMVFGFPLV